MKNGYLAPLLLLVFVFLIDPSEEGCMELFKIADWSKYERPVQPIALVKTQDSKDIMECSLERMCIKPRKIHTNICYILDHCFNRSDSQIVSKISKKCEGEKFTTIQLFHFMCWTAKAIDVEISHKYCDNYARLFSVYNQISFPPTTGQTTLSPKTNATLPESTTVTTTTTTTTTATTNTATTTVTLPLTTTKLQTATTKVTTVPDGSNKGQLSNTESSSDNSTHEKETLTLKILLLISVVFNVAGPLLVYLYMRRWKGPMLVQNGTNGAELKPLSEL